MNIAFVINYKVGTGSTVFFKIKQTDYQEFLGKIGISYFALPFDSFYLFSMHFINAIQSGKNLVFNTKILQIVLQSSIFGLVKLFSFSRALVPIFNDILFNIGTKKWSNEMKYWVRKWNINFYNFSCRFLNPNYFFPFELYLFY